MRIAVNDDNDSAFGTVHAGSLLNAVPDLWLTDLCHKQRIWPLHISIIKQTNKQIVLGTFLDPWQGSYLTKKTPVFIFIASDNDGAPFCQMGGSCGSEGNSRKGNSFTCLDLTV